MFTNLTLINPLKENELFSIHKNKKKFFSQHSSHTIYKPNKTSFTSLKKDKNNVVSLTDINKRNKTNYNLKKTFLSHIPYPSFSNNNKIPSIYQNFKTIKNQKTNDRKFALFNYKKFLNQNNKIICLKHNPKLRLKTETGKNKTITLNNKNQICNGNNDFSQLNNFSSYPNIFRNKNNSKTIDNKSCVKTSYFNDILNNMMHLVEVRDDHNNNIFYTKVANLLLEEMRKLEMGRLNKLKSETTKNLSILKLGKDRLSNRKILLSGYSDSSNNKRKLKRLNSLKSSMNFNMNFFQKYGFNFENQIGNKVRNFFSRRKSVSFLPSFAQMENTKNTYKINNKEYKDEYNQTIDNSTINNSITNNNTINNNNNADNINNNRNKRNYFVGKVKHEILKKNKQYLNIINDSKNVYENSNNNNYRTDGNSQLINFNKSNTTNNIFNNFIRDNIKRKETAENEQKQKQNNRSIKNKEKEKEKEKEEAFSFANLLDNIVNQINNKPNKTDKKDNIDKNEKTEKENNSIFENIHINMSNLSIFEQMVYNPRLIQLIHEYEEEKEKQNEINKNDIKEEKKEKENINIKENNKKKVEKENIDIKDNKNNIIKTYKNDTEKEKEKEKEIKINWKDKSKFSKGEKDKNEKKEEIEKEKIKKEGLENEFQNDKENSNEKGENKIKSILKNGKEKEEKSKIEEEKKIKVNAFMIKEIELGLEIIKHICNEIDADKNEEEELVNVINNLKEITQKEDASKKEISYQKKIMRVLNEIINEYIKNMNRINASKKKPKTLFSKSFKLYLKKKLKQIIKISPDDYYYEEEEEEDDKEDIPKIRIRIKLEEKEPKKSKTESKKLVYDNSYFFNKNKHKEDLDNLKLKINSALYEDNDNKEKESMSNKNTILGASTSTDFEYNGHKKKTKTSGKSSKFYRTKKSIGLKKLIDEQTENIKKKIFRVEENYNLRNNEILEKKLKQFFEQIRQLKNVRNSKDEERLRIFIDKEMEKFDYTQQKKLEERKFNFYNDLKIQRMASINGKLSRSKYQYQSPIIFNTLKNKE